MYLGIPYAAPPVGMLRWRTPGAPSGWTGVRDATQFSQHCISILGSLDDVLSGNATQSEDCLYLNVYVPGSVQSIG